MTPLYEYDLYYPFSAAGALTPTRSQLAPLKSSLTEFFGGLTDFRHRSSGTWTMGGVTFRDEVVLLRLLHPDRMQARAFLQNVKQQLERDLEQEQILIVEREIAALE